MIIECPVCPKPAPRYKIDASLIGAEGREVRCPRCGHEWFVTPEEVAQQSDLPLQPPPPPDPASLGGRYPHPQQIVGMTFEAAPPYDEPQESSGLGGGASRSSAPFAPQPVSAGAALAGAAAGVGAESELPEPEASDDPSGTPHVPTTAAEIASAFFASSFEDEDDAPPQERPEEPKTSFSLWAALDSVRPPEDDRAQAHGLSTPSDAPLPSEPKSAFHASPAQIHQTSSFDDPPVFDEAAEFAHLPDPEEEDVAHSRADSYWSRSFHAADSGDNTESAYGAPASSSDADALPTGASSRDEELKSALASADWSHDEPSAESASSRQSPNAPEGWAPATEAKEIARLVQALNGREAARNPTHGFEENAEEAPRASYWPSEHHSRNDDFGATGGWRSTVSSSNPEHRDLPDFNEDFPEPDEEPTPRSAPSFLRSRQNYPNQDYTNQDYPGKGYPSHQEQPFEPIPTRTALVRRGPSDFPDDDFPADFDDALAVEPRKMGGLAVAAAWGVFITIVAGLSGAAIHFREDIATRLPGTARLYQALNVPVAGHSGKLEFANVKYRWALRDEQPMIALEGDIISRSNTVERVPALVVAIRDGDRSFPQKRIENLLTEEIEANGTTHFTVDVTHPPKSVNEIAIEFVK